MTELNPSPSTPPTEPKAPYPCAYCDDFTNMTICARCQALAGPQSIMRQRRWTSWEPPEETLTLRPRLVEVESQFQLPAETPSPDRKYISDTERHGLKTLGSKTEGNTTGTSLSLRILTTVLIILIIIYIGCLVLGIDPIYMVIRLFT